MCLIALFLLIHTQCLVLTFLRSCYLQVSVQDLYRAGAAVVGRSGNQTLNSLKILGLITVGAFVRPCYLSLHTDCIDRFE